jgi:hypothetical protein
MNGPDTTTRALLAFMFLFCLVSVPVVYILVQHNNPQPAIGISKSSPPSDVVQFNENGKELQETTLYASGSKFDGVNKESDDVFKISQILTVPTPGYSSFGAFVFVHDLGYITVSATLTVNSFSQEVLRFYSFVEDQFDFQVEISVPTNNGNSVICYGAYFPSMGTLGETLYLAVSTGIKGSGQFISNHVFGREVHLFYYSDKDKPEDGVISRQWTYQDNFKQLTHPYFTGYKVQEPWVGCFGNKLQAVNDKTIFGIRQSLYISGTQFESHGADPSSGGIFWYTLSDNTANPALELQCYIQDAKLLYISQLPGLTYPNTASKKPEYCSDEIIPKIDQGVVFYHMFGFGSQFFVQSNIEGESLLAVSNITNKDTECVHNDNEINSCAPSGYVQLYKLTNSNNATELPMWQQVISNPDDDSNNTYIHRIWPNSDYVHKTNGFGAGIFMIDNFLFITMLYGEYNHENKLLVYNTDNGDKHSAVNDNNMKPIESFTLPLSHFRTRNSNTYNSPIFQIDKYLCVSTFDHTAKIDTIALYDVSARSKNHQLFSNFSNDLTQTFGKSVSSGSVPLQAYKGFGQWCQPWKNRLGGNYLVIDDPNYNNSGRVFIYKKE